jgi:hypothetical protein
MALLSPLAFSYFVTDLSSEVDPSTNLESPKKIFVVRRHNDQHGIEKMILDEF